MQSDAEKSQTSSPFPQAEVIDFGNIAISFSGGGYRAAAFHLGSLDILHRLGLLDKVTMLSTVSGNSYGGKVCTLTQQERSKDRSKYILQ